MNRNELIDTIQKYKSKCKMLGMEPIDISIYRNKPIIVNTGDLKEKNIMYLIF